MNDINAKMKEKLLADRQQDPEANNDDDKKKEEEEKEEEKEKKSIWRDFIDIDFYDLFKQLSPIIPTLPSVYAIIISMFRDQSSSSIANWFKVLDFIENLNICLYSISATIFYKIFKKKKKNQDKVRMKLALNVQKLNKLFLIYCFLISGAKLVLGIILPAVDDVPDDQTVGLFIFSLFAKVGLILAQLFYLYTVYVKKYYKSLPILEDAADNGFVDESKKNEDEDDTDEKGLKNLKKKKKQKEKEKKKKRKPDERKNQQEEVLQALKKENEEKEKTNERLLSMVENLSKASENWSDLKEEFSTLKKLNFILLKFAKPLLEDIKLNITNGMGDGDKSFLAVTVKVTDEVQDVKQRVRSQFGLPEKATKLVLKTNQGEELEDDEFMGKYSSLEEGLKLTYSL